MNRIASRGHQSGVGIINFLHSLGHVNFGQLLSDVRHGSINLGFPVDPSTITGLQASDFHCIHCMEAKITDKSYPLSDNRVELPGQLLQADIHGPVVVSCGKHEYVLVVVDEGSQYVWTIPLVRKSDAHEAMMTIWALVKCQTNNRVRFIRTDNGGEWTQLGRDCAKRGTIHQTTVPGAHEQNGKVERMIRAINNLTRATLTACQLNNEVWPYAVQFVAQTFNGLHCPKGDHRTNFELFWGHTPNLARI